MKSFCFRMHAHIEAESAFGAALKASSAILAGLMHKDPGNGLTELEIACVESGDQPEVEAPPTQLPATGGLNS